MQIRIWLAITSAALAWGTTGVATRAALNAGVPPLAMAAVRAILASVVLYAVLRLRGRRITREPDRWRIGAVAGMFQLATPFILFTLAYQYASAGFVGLLTALIPLGTAILAHFMLPDEPLHGAKVVGLMVAFSGVAILLLSGDSGLAEGGRPILAAILSIGSVTSISFAGVYSKGRVGRYDPTELTWMQFTMGGALITVVMLIGEGWPAQFTAWGWTLLLYLTIAGSVFPFLVFYWLLRHVTSTKASLVGYVVPLVAISAGVILLDEQVQLGIAIGGVLILAGIVLTSRSERIVTVRT
jgi:drug/metabolite transporter (DMT)-like permease